MEAAHPAERRLTAALRCLTAPLFSWLLDGGWGSSGACHPLARAARRLAMSQSLF
jgi:hypothetical protein